MDTEKLIGLVRSNVFLYDVGHNDYKKIKTSSVYDCTVEDVEYIYNTLSLLVTHSRCLVVVITLP